MERRKLIGIIGSGTCEERIAGIAYQVGQLIARSGCGLVCGGLGGVMEHACRGARSGGGLTVGILPGDSPETVNPYVEVAVATGMGIARNALVVRTADVLIAISGGPGTLSEIAFSVQLGKPVIGIETFDVLPEVIEASSPEEAVECALGHL